MAGLHIPITADNGNFMRVLHEVTAGVRDASQQIEAQGGNIDRVISNIKSGIATIGIGVGFKELAGQVANTRGEFQQLEVAFKTMLGSEEEATRLMSQLIDTAAKTPFGLQEVSTGAKQLLAFGLEADKVNETLIRLGDISAGLGTNLGDLVYLYGTTMAQGRLYTQDLNQFTGRGIPMIGELAKQFGVAESKVKELVESGKVGFPEVQKVIESLTNQGGKFGGLMEAQSKTISGQISNIEDAISTMFNEIGKSSEGLIDTTLNVTSTMVENWQTVLAILGDITFAYGAQKAVLALDSGFTKAATNYGYDAEIEQLKALLPLKEEEQMTSLQQAVASGNLTEAKAAEIASLREEAQAQLSALTAKEAAAKAEEAAAASKLDSIKEEILGIEDLKQALLGQYTEAANAGDAEKAQAIATDIAATETWLKEEAATAATAAEELRTAATNASAASEARETLATQINTAQTAGNTAATGVLTIAKEKLAVAIGKVNLMLKANQFAIAAGAALALAYGVYKLSTAQSDYEKALESADEAVRKQESSMREEQSTLDGLRKKLEGAKKGSDEWKSTKDQIVSQFGKYHSGLDAEIEKTGTLASSYDRLTKSIRLSAAARAMDDYRKENDPSKEVDMTLENVRRSLTESKKMKVDNAGNIVKGKNGGIEFVDAIAGPLLESIMQKTYEYLQDGDLGRFNAKELAYLTQTGQLSKSGIRSSMQKTRDRIETNKAGEQRIAQRYGTSIAEIDGMEVGENVKVSANLKTVYDTAAKNYKDAQKKVEDMKKNRSAYTEKQWEEAQEKLKDSKEAYEKAGGDTKAKSGPTSAQIASKEEDAAAKLADILRKQGQERLRIEQDYEYERWQSRINLMKEGEAKILEQQRLDFDKEKTELGRRLENELEAELNRQMAVFNAEQDALAAGNRKYAKKTFRDSDIDESAMKTIRDRYALLQEDLTKAQRKAEADRIQAAKESFNAYLKEFGSYQQKREAIEADYAKQIESAPDQGARMMAMANRNKALADLDFNEWQEGGGMALAFGDISKLSKDTISGLIDDMEKYRSKIIATFDPEKIQKYEEALNNLRMAEATSGSFFDGDNDVLQSMRERLAIQRQLADEEANEVELKRQKAEIEMRLATLKLTPSLNLGTAPDGEQIATSIAPTQEDIVLADELSVQLDAIDNALKSSGSNSTQLRSQLQALGKVKFSDIEKFSQQIQKAGENAAEFASIFSDDVADGISEATGMLGGMMEAFTELTSGIRTLAESGKEVVEKTAKASGDIVESASAGMEASAASAAGSLSAMEKASAILAIIGAAIQMATMIASLVNPDRKHEKNIEALQKRIDALDRSCDKLGKSISKAYSYDASALIGQQETLLRQQKALVAQQMQEEMSKKKSDDDKIRQYREQIEDLDEAIADAKESAKDAIFGDDLKSQIEDFASAYSEAWSSGESRVMSARDTVRKMMRQMAEESIKAAIQGSGAMERIRQTLADFYSDNILTAGEQDYIYGLADELQKELDARFGQQADLLSDTYSQNPTAKGWDTFTQDQADVLTGRFTAFCETSEAIRGINAGIAESVKSSLLLASAQRDLMQDALNIHIVNMGHLEAISKNTRELATIREDLGKIERYVRNL